MMLALAGNHLAETAAATGASRLAFTEATEALRQSPPSAPESVTLPVLEDHDDRPRDLSSLYAGRAVLVVFSLGAWSAPCMSALRLLESRRAAIEDSNTSIVAISADAVDRIATMRIQNRLGFLAVHDHAGRFAQSLGLAFRVSAEARADLRAIGVRLQRWNGEASNQLALPATLLLDVERTARLFIHEAPGGPRTDVAAAIDAVLAG